MAKTHQIFIGSDTDVSFNVARDNRTGDVIEDATATFTLRDSAGDIVMGIEDISMPHQEGSKGRYYGTIPGTTPLVEGDDYQIEITVVASGGRDRTVLVDAVAVRDVG